MNQSKECNCSKELMDMNIILESEVGYYISSLPEVFFKSYESALVYANEHDIVVTRTR